MKSFFTRLAITLIAPILAVHADEGFYLASDTVCATGDGDAGGDGAFGFTSECFSGTSIVPWGSWNCHTLQNPPAYMWTDGDGSFHVKGDNGNFCGVGQLDMYKQCDGCANYDVYIAGGNGVPVGWCWPVPHGQTDSCYAPILSDDVYGEYAYCQLYGDGLSKC